MLRTNSTSLHSHTYLLLSHDRVRRRIFCFHLTTTDALTHWLTSVKVILNLFSQASNSSSRWRRSKAGTFSDWLERIITVSPLTSPRRWSKWNYRMRRRRRRRWWLRRKSFFVDFSMIRSGMKYLSMMPGAWTVYWELEIANVLFVLPVSVFEERHLGTILHFFPVESFSSDEFSLNVVGNST